MEKRELIAMMERMGWGEVEMATGRAWQLSSGPCDRMVAVYDADDVVLCATRGEGHVLTSIADAAEWVSKASERAMERGR